MKSIMVGALVAVAFPVFFRAQAKSEDISPAEVQALLNLPLSQAIKQRDTYKGPVKFAYDRQNAMTGKDCQSEQGQQPYNVCMGEAVEQAEKDLAIFYRNLQMLCHSQDQLATLQTMDKAWLSYEESGMKAAHAAWPDGSGAPAFASHVHLSFIRDHMREMKELFALNLFQ